MRSALTHLHSGLFSNVKVKAVSLSLIISLERRCPAEMVCSQLSAAAKGEVREVNRFIYWVGCCNNLSSVSLAAVFRWVMESGGFPPDLHSRASLLLQVLSQLQMHLLT